MDPVKFQDIQTDTQSSEHKPKLPPSPQGNGDDFHMPEKTRHTSEEEKQMRQNIEHSMAQMSLQTLQHNANAARARQKEAQRNQ